MLLTPVRVRQPRPVQLQSAMEANLAKASAAAVGTEEAVESAPPLVPGMPTKSLGGVVPVTTANSMVVRNGVLVLPGTENAGGGLPTYSMPHPGVGEM